MRILKCVVCAYERSSEDDGRMFEDDDLTPGSLICDLCSSIEKGTSELLRTGKTVISTPDPMQQIIVTLSREY